MTASANAPTGQRQALGRPIARQVSSAEQIRFVGQLQRGSPMNSPAYKHPPVLQFYFGHAGATALLGLLLPNGAHLGDLHAFLLPLIELIPNVMRLTNRSPDPVFAKTFIGMSLLIAFAILVFYVVAMRGRGYHTRSFDSTYRRALFLACAWCAVGLGIAIFWAMPMLDPLSKGRAYFILRAATSSNIGVVTAMNQLLVGSPLFLFLFLSFAHSCTSTRYRARLI